MLRHPGDSSSMVRHRLLPPSWNGICLGLSSSRPPSFLSTWITPCNATDRGQTEVTVYRTKCIAVNMLMEFFPFCIELINVENREFLLGQNRFHCLLCNADDKYILNDVTVHILSSLKFKIASTILNQEKVCKFFSIHLHPQRQQGCLRILS